MRVALIGYGRMGKTIDALAADAGVSIVARIDPQADHSDQQQITSSALQGAEVCIDFTHPDTVMDNIAALAKMGKSMVIGTTGWTDQLETVRSIVTDAGVGAVYAPNFSIGVSLFLEVVRTAAKLIDRVDAYDVSVIESHHRLKADAPSGTAEVIAGVLLEEIDRKNAVQQCVCDGVIASDALQVASVRCGSIAGTHSVMMDSVADTITLTHEAHNRDGFATGALEAAKWVQGKQGLFHFNEMWR